MHLSSKRTKQLLKGSKPLVDTPNNKAAVIALREIAEHRVRLPKGWDIRSIDAATEVELPPDQR